MEDKVYDLIVHYMSYKGTIPKVDPDRYNYVDLLDDIRVVALCRVPGIGGLNFSLKCSMKGCIDLGDVSNDNNLLTMFEQNVNNTSINLFLEVSKNLDNVDEADVGEEGDDERNDGEFDDLVNVGDSGDEDFLSDKTKSGNRMKQKNTGGGDIDGDKERARAVDKQYESDFAAKIGGESETSEDYGSDGSDCWLSGYESDDHCEAQNDSDEDFMNDPLHGCIDRDEFVPPSENEKKIELKNKMVFENVHVFRVALQDFAVQEGFNIERVKNEKTRVTAYCLGVGCEWRIHASLMTDKCSFQIRTYNDIHLCVRESKLKEATSTWMARQLLESLREDPDMKPKALTIELKKKSGVTPSYMTLYRARQKALDIIEGNHAESFTKLPKYAEMVRLTNPGSIVKIQYHLYEEGEELSCIQRSPSFKRFFLGLDALKQGYLSGCSPFLGFDGCHLKGSFGGVLLSAIGLDGNNGLYPVAFAVVETECKDSWGFFFENLADFLGGFNADKPWTFMTDRQKGLVESINEMVPNAINRKCARHIFANFRLQFPGKTLKKYFWIAARAYNAADFNFALNKINELSPRGYKWLLEIPAEFWSRHAYGLAIKNEHVTNNLSESFNNWVSELRPKPILSLVDGLRAKLMCFIQRRYKSGRKWKGVVVPNVLKKLNEIALMARQCTIVGAGRSEFEISDKGVNYIVDLNKRTCNCKVWDVCGIPCKHAATAIGYRRENLQNYTDHSYSVKNFMKAYTPEVHAVPAHTFWPEMDVTPSTLLPPPTKRLPGRPKKNRKREMGEGEAVGRSKIVRCKKCHSVGHNSRTCGKSTVHSKRGRKTISRETNTSQELDAGSQPSVTGLQNPGMTTGEVGSSKEKRKKKATSKTKKKGKVASGEGIQKD